MTDVWTTERTDQLRALYADPETEWSFAEIAEKLGGISRNSVIGKAHRLGLDKRKAGKKPKAHQVRSRPARKTPVRLPPGAPKFSAELFVCAEATDIVPRHLTLAELEENDCRHPYGDDAFTFCGHQKMDGSRYCAAHYRLNRSAVPPRKSVNPTAFGRAKGGVFGRVA